MSPKVCVVLSECTSCSGLSMGEFEQIRSALSHDPRVASVISIEPPCFRAARKELKKLSLKEGDRAVVALWCSPETLGFSTLLSKSIPKSFVELVDLNLLSCKGAGGAGRLDMLIQAIRAAVAKVRLAERARDRRVRYANGALAVIGSSERAFLAARAIASTGVETKLLLPGTVRADEMDKNIEIIDQAVPGAILGYPGNFLLPYLRAGERGRLNVAAVLIVSERSRAIPKAPVGSGIAVVPLDEFVDYASAGNGARGIVFTDDNSLLDPSAPIVTAAWHLMLERAKSAALSGMAESVIVLARDIKATGLLELLWREAAEAGVQFVRYDDRSRPKLGSEGRIVLVKDLVLGELLRLPADVIVVPTTFRPQEPVFIEKLFMPADWDLRVRSSGPQRGTGLSTCEGIFLLGYADQVRLKDALEPEFTATIGKVLAFLREGKTLVRGEVAEVDGEKCSACLTCVRSCPYRAAKMDDEMKAEIVPEKCAGCGNCVSVCPSRAITLKNCTDEQIRAQMEILTEEVIQ